MAGGDYGFVEIPVIAIGGVMVERLPQVLQRELTASPSGANC